MLVIKGGGKSEPVVRQDVERGLKDDTSEKMFALAGSYNIIRSVNEVLTCALLCPRPGLGLIDDEPKGEGGHEAGPQRYFC